MKKIIVLALSAIFAINNISAQKQHSINPETNTIERNFYDSYRTPQRGEFTQKGASPKRTTKPTVTSNVNFMNFYPFKDIETISPRPMLFITGDQVHSKEFSEDAYRRSAKSKELYYVKGVKHVDFYDRLDLILFDKLDAFFERYLNN